ncbi:MAG: dihydrodipicolinate synthase family protein, partial [Deltaproteobacteria bacterium]|nr:dihydrodipicolinate synthase family protein [Deltaproteobacteria bacterium]
MEGTSLDNWEGPFVAIVTPFDEQGRIILEDFKTLIHSFVEDGARGIVVAGHNGESWNLKLQEMVQLISIAKKEVENRVPVLCGVEERNADAVIELANVLAEAGVEGIMVEPPYVVTTSTDAEIIDRFE